MEYYKIFLINYKISTSDKKPALGYAGEIIKPNYFKEHIARVPG